MTHNPSTLSASHSPKTQRGGMVRAARKPPTFERFVFLRRGRSREPKVRKPTDVPLPNPPKRRKFRSILRIFPPTPLLGGNLRSDQTKTDGSPSSLFPTTRLGSPAWKRHNGERAKVRGANGFRSPRRRILRKCPIGMTSRMDARWAQQFNGFGADPLLAHRSLHPLRVDLTRLDGVGDSPTRIRQQLRDGVGARAPRCPGVYGMIDALGRLIYVGKSKLLRNRLLSYFIPGNKDEKAGRIVELARSIVWEVQPSEFAALLREQSLIRTWQPTLNVIGMPNRRQSAFLCLGRGPAEQLYLARQFDPSASACQGPFSGSGQLLRAVEILNRHFLLRDCSQKTATHLTDQLALFVIESRAGCLRAELGTCIAPCLKDASRAKYLRQEKAARGFLAGEPSDVVERLQAEMERAASGMHFERAARLREDVRIMKWLTGKLQQHRKARESSPRIYWEPHAVSEQIAAPKSAQAGVLYLMRQGGVEFAVGCPASEREWKACRRTILEWYRSDQQFQSQYLRSADSLGLAAAWFQKNPASRKRLLPVESIEAIPKSWGEFQQEWIGRLRPDLESGADPSPCQPAATSGPPKGETRCRGTSSASRSSRP